MDDGAGDDVELVFPLGGFTCSAWGEYGWLVVRDDRGVEAQIGLNSDEHRAQAAGLVERRARVARVVATRDGTLVAEFDEGVSVVVRPALEFEAWEVRGPGEVIVGCLPIGGGYPMWNIDVPENWWT